MGKYVIFANFDGDDYYKAKRSPSLFLQGVNPHLQIKVTEIEVLTYNESNTISGNLKDNNGTNLTSYPVSIKILTPDNTTTTITTNTDNNGNFTTSYTPTIRGEYTIWAETSKTDSYSRTISKEQLVLTDTLNTTTSISCDVETCIIDNTIQLVATVKEGNNNVSGVDVRFYNGDTLITKNDLADGSNPTFKTNTDGECIINYPISEVKNYTFHAVCLGNAQYNNSTSTNITVTGAKHTLTVELLPSTVYRGWNPVIQVINENNQSVSGLSFTVGVGGETMTLTSNNSGQIVLPIINTVGNTTITVQLSNATGYNNINQSLTLKVLDTLTLTRNGLTATNYNEKIPYKSWKNLSNMKVKNDGNYTVCGTNCYSDMLASRAGTLNTPAPLKFSDFGLELPSGAILDKLIVTMRIRTLSCSSASANVSITAPTLSILGNTKVMTLPPTKSGNTTSLLPFQDFGDVTAEIDLSNITVGELNNTSNYFTITFPRNTSGNTGRLQIDYVEIKVLYTPPMGV